MTRDTKVQIGAAMALLLFLATSVGLTTTLAALQGREKLVQTDSAENSASAEVATGIAMGAFRGIFVNFLWIRANEMKEAGKFFEAIELAGAITRLQPRFPRVWVFHAWNMAYNISVMTSTSEERWNWVNAGIRLLRDKGIPANPNDMLLHKELGWMFLHKIGGYTDDANAYYKRRLALEWTVMLGPPPPTTALDRDRDHRIKVMSDWLETIATAAATLDEAKQREPTLASLIEQIEKNGYKLDFDLLGRYEMIRASRRSIIRPEYVARLTAGRQNADIPAPMEQMMTLIEDSEREAAWKTLVAYLRRKLLADEYHMDPQRMIQLTQRYGPIDWRHHAAHALYWSTRGIDQGFFRITQDNRRDFDTLNTDRISVQAIQDLFRTGELYFDFFAMTMGKGAYAMFQGLPNGHFVQSYGQIVENEARNRSWADQTDSRGITSLSGGYENFLKDAICFFYRRFDMKQADYWYTKLRTYENLNLGNENRAQELSVPIAEFVERELNDRATSPNVAISQIAGSLMGAYTSGLLAGDQELFQSQFEFAKRFHRYFFQEQRKAVIVSKEYVRMDQLEPDFRLAAGGIFAQWIQTLGVDDARSVYARAPEDLRRFAYDIMRGSYEDRLTQATQAGLSEPFAVIFPEPPGMARFRIELKAMLAQRGEGAVNVEQK